VLNIISGCLYSSQLSAMQIAYFWHPIASSVACLTLMYFSALSHKRQDVWKGGGGYWP